MPAGERLVPLKEREPSRSKLPVFVVALSVGQGSSLVVKVFVMLKLPLLSKGSEFSEVGSGLSVHVLITLELEEDSVPPIVPEPIQDVKSLSSVSLFSIGLPSPSASVQPPA